MQLTVYNRLIQDRKLVRHLVHETKKTGRDSFIQRCNSCEIALDFLHNSLSKDELVEGRVYL